jgi:hypothetical protein
MRHVTTAVVPIALACVVVAGCGLLGAAGPQPSGAATEPPAAVEPSPSPSLATEPSPGSGTAPTPLAPSPGSPSPSRVGGPEGDAVLVGAGDIARCGAEGDEATAALLDRIPGIVFTAGDNAYPSGTDRDFDRCYNVGWGRHRERTRPAPGNHEYRSGSADPYFDYFGERAGPRHLGWYSYDAGDWHVVVLNSNCSEVGCRRGSDQEQWLRADLAAHPAACTLAYWHHPRFSSGMHGNHDRVKDFWDALYEAGADVVVSGHDHDYERFAPMTPDGELDTARGIREFVVGTGGGDLRPFEQTVPNSEVRESGTFGVLKLTLRRGGYDWEFVPAAGATFRDSGSGTCH